MTSAWERVRKSLAGTLLLLPALLLMSCAMGPDYVRPHVETAEKFRMSETEGQSIANLPWWELLRDEELQRLIRQALEENGISSRRLRAWKSSRLA